MSFKNDSGRTNFSGLNFPKASDILPLSPSNILSGSTLESAEEGDVSAQNFDVAPSTHAVAPPSKMSRLFTYIDLHGHASKRGLFASFLILSIELDFIGL